MKFTLAALCFLLGFSFATADILEFRDGTLLDGTYQGGTAGTIRFESSGKMEVYPVNSVLALTITRGVETTQKPAAPSTPPSVAQAPNTGARHTVPVGSDVIIQLRSEISTVSARPGQKFDAILETDLRAGSVIVAPRGSIVRGTITEVRKPRRIVKTAALRFTLDDIIVGNRTIRIQTNTQSAETHPDGSIIRGAAKGAIVGEIVDNDSGKGAEVGASLAALKKGDHIVYSAGSLVTFNLTRSLTVTN